MSELSKKQKIIIYVIGGILLVITAIIVYFSNTEDESEQANNTEVSGVEDSNITNEQNAIVVELPEEEIKKEITVHIIGAVEKEGIVKLKEGSRLIDAIEKAGGEKLYADLSKVNLAYVLEDGQKIKIPSIYDKEEDEYITDDSGNSIQENKVSSSKEKDSKLSTKGGDIVDINSADLEELQTLPGIGESTAQKILDYREENGKFNTIDDIKNVSGIGDAKFNNIKEYIKVR